MKVPRANPKRLDILGTGIKSDQEIFSSVLKRWGQKIAYCSMFAVVPAALATHLAEARSDESKKPEPNVAEGQARLREKLNLNRSNPALLKRQSTFRLPHQKGSFNLLATLAGTDNCPGRAIPGGSYTAAEPYTDSGDTTGANNTIAQVVGYYYYNNYDAEGPDHVYSFTLTGRGPNPQIQVSTTSGSYKPLIYLVYGGYFGACPVGTGNTLFSPWGIAESSADGTATLTGWQLESIPLGVPFHLFIDSKFNNASGAGPYTLRMQDVAISSPACDNQIDCAAFFVHQQYRDFLNREPDPAGFAAWLALLNNCQPGDTSCDRIHVSRAFFQSPEFQGRGYFLYRFYNVAFGRKPDFDEFAHDMGYVSGFLTDAQLEAQKIRFLADFMGRPAFKAKYNSLSNTQFVDTLLSEAGVTHPSRDSWITALNNGSKAPYEVMRELAESTQVYNKYYNQAFVVMQYFGYLRRQPDALYLNWIAHLDATGDSRSMIDGFINSLEYRARFAAQ